MKIKRDEDKKKKKELTEEEKELRDLKRAKNIGLASAAAGGLLAGVSRLGRKFNEQPSIKESIGTDNDKSIRKSTLGAQKWIGGGLAASGLALHGISAIKYRKLKKKLDAQKKEEEDKKNDNPKK